MLALYLAACTAPTPDGKTSDDAPDGTDTDDTDGLSDPRTDPLDIQAVVAPDVQTVVIVTWRTETPVRGYVAFGEDTTYRLASAVEDAPATEHRALLLGLYADTEFHFRVASVGESGETHSPDLTITTGSLPPALHPLIVSGVATSWHGYQVVPLQGATYAIVLLDDHGRYVWYHLLEQSGNLMRTFLANDRQSVVLCLAGPQDNLAIGKIVRVSMDGATTTELPLPNMDHDMTELPDGTVAAIVVEPDPAGGGETADSIVELAPDGTLTTVFSAWDAWDPDALGLRNNSNWTHANAIEYDAVEDAYYFSMKSLASLAKIDRATGEVLWTMHGRLNEFTFPEGQEAIELQHQFEMLPTGVLIFDNGLGERGYSRVVELEVDFEAKTAHQVWEYIRDPSVYVFAKGDVARFADGGTQVVWSTSGEIQNVARDGTVTWQLDTELGQAMTFVDIVDTLYVE